MNQLFELDEISVCVAIECLILVLHGLSWQSYKQSKGFIIAQAPMESTSRDFWKMVYERECGVVVMLSRLEEDDQVHSELGSVLELCW